MKELVLNYLKNNLNQQQFEAATYTDGHSLILAGAGSGKTRTLTYKIAYLILGKKVDPRNILAVTFTNKAANEMKERIIKISQDIEKKLLSGDFNIKNDDEINTELDFDEIIENSLGKGSIKKEQEEIERLNFSYEKISKNLWIGTFHSIFLRILKQDINKLNKGYNSDFIIYDSEDSTKIIKDIIKNSKIADTIEVKTVKSRITQRKNNGLTPQAAAYEVSNDLDEIILKVYEKYQKQLEKANALDFDDLLLLPYILFKKEPDILEKRHKKFKYILVDEAQDTNWIQFELIKMLSYGKNYFKLNNNGIEGTSIVTFIGDDFQAIYGWRGAVMDNFLNVNKRWSNIKTFKLETNYRSRPHIIKAGNAIIAQNKKQYQKQIKPYREGQDYIRLLVWDNDMDEADGIVQLIKKLKENKNLKRSDFAILYRTNAQSQPFEQVLISEGIPYKIWGGFKFFERKEIKDILAYLRYIINPKDNISLKRIINTPSRKIGDTTIKKIEEYGIMHGIDISEIIQNIDNVMVNLPMNTKIKIKQFNTLIKFLQSQITDLTPAEFIKNLIQTIKYEEWLKQTEGEEKAQERLENIGQLINLASNFEEKGHQGLKKFLEEVSLMSEIEDQGNEEGDFVKLMTIHASKGLEFPIVFIVGLEENVFPISRANLDPNELEEERRLMYVAITRAKDYLFLSYAKARQKWGSMKYNKPSRFLEELPTDLLKIYEGNGSNKKRYHINQNIYEGDIVRHKIFGKGEVLEIWNDIAIVKFYNPAFGTRKTNINSLEKI